MTTHRQIIAAMLAANLLNAEAVDYEQRMHPNKIDPLDEIDSLELEYQLIKKKQSKLSRVNRERVVYLVDHMEEIPDA